MKILDFLIRWELICPDCGRGEDDMDFKPNGEVVCSCGQRVRRS